MVYKIKKESHFKSVVWLNKKLLLCFIYNMDQNVTRPLVSEAGMRIMRQLIGQPPQTMTQLIDVLKVTRTAVSEQLSELTAIGYVGQTLVHCGGRGRPRFSFSATELAMRRLFEGNQDIVVPAMWRSIRRHFDDEAVEKIAHDVAVEIARQFTKQMKGKSYRSRMKEFVDILVRTGRLAEYHEKKNGVEIRKFNCPFISMADETGTLCRIDRLCMQIIVGNKELAPVKLTSSRHDGNSCCTFYLDLNSKDSMQFSNLGIDI